MGSPNATKLRNTAGHIHEGGRWRLLWLFANVACRAPAGRQFLALFGPFIANGTAGEFAKLAVHPFDISGTPLRVRPEPL